MNSTAKWWLPIAASFAVYLIPLVGPHAVFLVGEMIYGGLTGRGGGVTGTWLAAEIAVAFAMQVVVAAVLAWAFRGGRARLVVPVLFAPFVIGAVEYAYMAALPAYFLVERETAPEVSLPESCTIAGAAMIDLRAPATGPVPAFTLAWAQRADGGFVLVRPAACQQIDPKLPRPSVAPGGRVEFMLGPVFATADGGAVLERTDVGPGTRTWSIYAPTRGRVEPLAIPAAQQSMPVLSDDGEAVAWIETVPQADAPATARLHLRGIDVSAPDRIVDLSPLGAATYVVGGYDRRRGEIWLWRDDRFMAVNADGVPLHRSEPAAAIRPQLQTWIGQTDATLQWDAYREQGPYWVAWKTPAGAGRSRIPLGRSVTSAALDPTGRYVAISTTTTVSVGGARDAVYVLRTRDGDEVFRRYFPTYTRSSVRFFAGGLFAYSDIAGTHVLRLPPG